MPLCDPKQARRFKSAAHDSPHGVLEGLLGSHQLAEHFGILLLLADLALHGLAVFSCGFKL